MSDDRDWVVHPGATLGEWMDERGVSIGELADQTRLSPTRIERLLAGHAPLTPVVAAKLQVATGISGQFWLNYETGFRKGLAAGKKWSP